MSKWEQEPKQHYREASWALFDLLCLFPLKAQLSKILFFFFSVGILSLEPSLLFQIHFPPTLPLLVCHWGGQLSVGDAWASSTKQICRGTGAQCADSACVEKEGWRERRSDAGRDKTVSMQQPKYLQHSSVTDGRLCQNRLTRLVSILDAKTTKVGGLIYTGD